MARTSSSAPPPEPEQKPEYEKILFDRLGIDPEVYQGDAQIKEIHARLLSAADAMRGRLTEFVGINVCIHVASSKVLLESRPEQLEMTLAELRREYKEIDASTIVTAASLYYAIKVLEERQGPGKKKIEHLRKRFSEIEWLVGADRARKLGLN